MSILVASRKRRILAFAVDFLLFGYLTSLTTYFVFAVLETPLDTPALHSISVQIGIWLLGVSVFAAKDTYKGLGPGKLLMGIRAYQVDDKPAGVLKQFVRNLSLFAWPIEAIVMIMNSNKRRIGDYLASTQVKRDPSISGSKRGMAALLIVCFYLFTPNLPSINVSQEGFMALSQYLVKQSNAYEVAEQAIFEQEAIEQLIGPVEIIHVDGNSQISIVNDEGSAQLILNVQGETGQLPVLVKLERTQGEWVITQMAFEQTQSLPLP